MSSRRPPKTELGLGVAFLTLSERVAQRKGANKWPSLLSAIQRTNLLPAECVRREIHLASFFKVPECPRAREEVSGVITG